MYRNSGKGVSGSPGNFSLAVSLLKGVREGLGEGTREGSEKGRRFRLGRVVVVEAHREHGFVSERGTRVSFALLRSVLSALFLSALFLSALFLSALSFFSPFALLLFCSCGFFLLYN